MDNMSDQEKIEFGQKKEKYYASEIEKLVLDTKTTNDELACVLSCIALLAQMEINKAKLIAILRRCDGVDVDGLNAQLIDEGGKAYRDFDNQMKRLDR